MQTEYPYAGLRPRLAALGVDFLIIATYAVILFVAAMTLILTTSVEQRLNSALARDFVAFVTLILPVVLYFSLQESSARQATIGKQKVGLKVVNKTGGRLSAGQSLLRSIVKFLPWQIAHTAVFQIYAGNESSLLFAVSILAQALVVIYLVSILLDKRRRAPYDWLAGSAVIRVDRATERDEYPPY